MTKWYAACSADIHTLTDKQITSWIAQLAGMDQGFTKNKTKFEKAKSLLSDARIDRGDLVTTKPRAAKGWGYHNWPYYSAALLVMIQEARRLPPMKCMSCSVTLAGPSQIFGTLLVCTSCKALAEEARTNIFAKIDEAKKSALSWLEDYILRGGLLKGSDGLNGSGLPVHVLSTLQGLQSHKAAEDTSDTASGRKHPTD